jgi:hypothetical protein
VRKLRACRAVFQRCAICLLLLAGFSALSAGVTRPSPIFINVDPMVPPDVPPQVDAVIFANQSLFIVSNNFLQLPITAAPYEAQSVRFWTNNGVMLGLPGFRFEYIPNRAHLTPRQRRRPGANLPQPSIVFYNDGEITVAQSLLVHAANIFNPGILAGDVRARIRINATNGLADLSRGAIHAGDLPLPACVSPSNFIFGPFFFGLDPQVTYSYFDSGISGFVNTNRSPLQLDSLAVSFTNIFGTNVVFGNFVPPNPVAPSAQYRQFSSVFPGAPATNLTTNVQFGVQGCGAYEAFVHVSTNFFGRDISVVFVPTNGFDTNVSVAVAFPTNGFGFPFFFTTEPIVEFRSTEFDVIQQKVITNYLTFRDDGASIFRGHDCTFDLSDPPNTPFTADLFYNTSFQTNTAQYNYTVAYAQVGNTNSFYFTNVASSLLFFPELGASPTASDPTNFNGNVEINARNLNLTQARIRGENAVHIQTSNLIGSSLSFVDAPFLTFDASTTNNTLSISNVIRPEVNRLQATLNSWAGAWTANVTNGAITNIFLDTNGVFVTNVIGRVETWSYHVLVLGACIDTLHPSIVHRLNLRAPNIVIEDNLAINASFRLEGKSVTFGSNATLSLPRGLNLAFTNIVGVTSLTNEGLLNIPQGAYFGAFEDGFAQPRLTRRQLRLIRQGRLSIPRLVTYDNFVNHDTIVASTFSARANYVEHSGARFVPAVINGTNGPVVLDGATLIISNASVTASSDIRLTAGNTLIARSVLTAGATNAGRFANNYLPGAIIIDATNSLTDGGLSASNEWFVTSGVRIERRPDPLSGAVGDLMGTHVISRAGVFAQAIHVWAGEDRGATVGGFENNLALGHLTLDGSLGNDFRFKSAEANNAIYVDYLELVRDATNYHLAIGVDPDFTIYFGDANILPEKIEETSGGRIRWVSQFTGPRSSTNIVYPNGVTYTFNAGVVRSRDRDDDGDNIVNAEDCTPISVPGFDSTQPCAMAPIAMKAASSTQNISLTIALDSGGREVVLNWDAAANSANTVEFADSLAGFGAAGWLPLTNFINGPVNARVTVKDAVGAPLRVYRVRVDAGKP